MTQVLSLWCMQVRMVPGFPFSFRVLRKCLSWATSNPEIRAPTFWVESALGGGSESTAGAVLLLRGAVPAAAGEAADPGAAAWSGQVLTPKVVSNSACFFVYLFWCVIFFEGTLVLGGLNRKPTGKQIISLGSI